MTLHNNIALLDFNILNDAQLSELNSSGLFIVKDLSPEQISLLENIFDKGVYLIQNNESQNTIGKSLFKLLFPQSGLQNVYLKLKQKTSELLLEPALELLKLKLTLDESILNSNSEVVLVESAIY